MLLNLLHVEIAADDDRDVAAVNVLDPSHARSDANRAVSLRRHVVVPVVASLDVRRARDDPFVDRTRRPFDHTRTALVPLEPQEYPRERDDASGHASGHASGGVAESSPGPAVDPLELTGVERLERVVPPPHAVLLPPRAPTKRVRDRLVDRVCAAERIVLRRGEQHAPRPRGGVRLPQRPHRRRVAPVLRGALLLAHLPRAHQLGRHAPEVLLEAQHVRRVPLHRARDDGAPHVPVPPAPALVRAGLVREPVRGVRVVVLEVPRHHPDARVLGDAAGAVGPRRRVPRGSAKDELRVVASCVVTVCAPDPPSSRRRRRRRRARCPNATSKMRRHVAPALSASRRHRRSITSPSTPSGRSAGASVYRHARRRPRLRRRRRRPRGVLSRDALGLASVPSRAQASLDLVLDDVGGADKAGVSLSSDPAKESRVDAPPGARRRRGRRRRVALGGEAPAGVPTLHAANPRAGLAAAGGGGRRFVSSLASSAARRISSPAVSSSPRVVRRGGAAGGFALEPSWIGCARWGLETRGRAGWTSASGVLVATGDPSAYGSVGSARFCLMLSYIHSWRRIVGGVPPPAPATHDAGMDARYAANLGSSSSAHGGSTRSTCVARRLRSLAGTTTTHPRSRRNPAHALSRNSWTARGAWSATTHDRSSSLDMGRPGERARRWRRARRGVVARTNFS